MKRLFCVLLIILILALAGCSETKNLKNGGTYFYIGRSTSWFATYSITKVNSSYYDSLSIQYLFDDKNIESQAEKIGPIEYILTGNSLKTESSYPQELEGVANFHTGSRMNADIIRVTIEKEIELTIKWQGKTETMKLKRQE